MPLLQPNDAGEISAQPHGQLVEQGDWFVLTTHGMYLTVPPDQVPWEAWWSWGQGAAITDAAFKFWVGDWLRIGFFAFGEKFAQAQELFPWWDEQTLMNIQRVGSRIAPTRRRLDPEHKLPFEYHEAVAACEPAVQDRLLDRASIDPSVTRDVLRDMVRSYKEPNPVLADVEFRASPIRRAIAAVDQCLTRLEGDPKDHVVIAGAELREALRLVEEPKRRPQ